MYPLTDTHAHLSDYDNGTLEMSVNEAAAAGIGMIINTATSINTARKVLTQCKSYPNSMKAAVGISPFDTIDINDDWAGELRDLLDDPAIVAIGEIGLDCTNPAYPPIDIQMPIFLKQLEVAKDAGLPAVIHSRGMEKKTAEICRDSGVKKAIFHCFTGDREAAEYIAGCGYYVSISGIITYKKSHLRDIIRYIPPDKLLIETDTPYLSPTPHRGKPNQPAFLIHTARETAKILELDEGEFFGILGENVDRAINIKRYSFFRY
jgi:TatD DNase family protein